MYGQAKKAYINIDNYIKEDKPVGKSSGLLGRSRGEQPEAVEDDPLARMAKVVQRIRKAREEIKNAKETG